ncbi:DTW domain-containing protein [Aurantivibrio plasticivorans]
MNVLDLLENWLQISNKSFSRQASVTAAEIACDCSGLINLAFEKLKLPFPYQLIRPKAVHYYASLQEIGSNKISQLNEGCLLAWRKDILPKSGDTGHVLVTAGKPTLVAKDRYSIPVFDSTKAEGGLAKRYIDLYTDEKGTIIGVKFHKSESKVKRTQIYHHSMVKTRYCFGCGLPRKVCNCGVIDPKLELPPIIILRHPGERKRTLSTVSLIKQRYPNVLVKDGELFSPLRKEHMALLFPSDGLEHAEQSITESDDQYYILLDATWRKAKKILHQNPWLQALPRTSLRPASASQYLLRKVTDEQSLSSVEAFAAVMQDNPLAEMLGGYMQKHIELMGEDIYQKNYKNHLNYKN